MADFTKPATLAPDTTPVAPKGAVVTPVDPFADQLGTMRRTERELNAAADAAINKVLRQSAR
jgi:hypothetical protein